MSDRIRLIVGLGNPGAQYVSTRHNIGERWVRQLAERLGGSWSTVTRFNSEICRVETTEGQLSLMFPLTFMNRSGDAVGKFLRYYNIELSEMLVAYDEMAFDPGIVRFRDGGGDNGHNGLRSLRAHCGGPDYYRMRIGVGHPGSPEKVTRYLTAASIPSQERIAIEAATDFSEDVLKMILSGAWSEVMTAVHTKPA